LSATPVSVHVPGPAPLPKPLVGQSALSLLDAEPDLANWVVPSERAAAARATRVPEVTVEAGPFDPAAVVSLGRDGFGALVLSGLISREVFLDGRPALRLQGPGDVFIDEPLGASPAETLVQWSACVSTRLAILDDHVLLAVRRWPRLLRGLCARMQQCHDMTLLQLSASHRPTVEDRIAGLFELLADRWGRMTAHGVVVPIALTHDAIGQMIGARRPTVTLGLRALALQGRLVREEGGR